MLHHVSLPVADLERAAGLYDAALCELGYRRVCQEPGFIGYGVEDGHDQFALKQIRPSASAGARFHLAFSAPGREAVDRFHAAALQYGATDQGAPGLRAHYGPDYYAAFVVDLDGHRIEAVISRPVAPLALGPASPFFIVRDVRLAVEYYREHLGFEVRALEPQDDPFFAIVGRDAVQVLLKAISSEIAPQPNASRHAWAPWDAFVFTRDPDVLASELQRRGARLHVPLGDRDDGLRGFEVLDRDGYVLFFGSPK